MVVTTNAEGTSRELVRSRVAFATRGLAGVRIFEALLVALAAYGVALTATLVSGGSLSGPAAWELAGVCALLAGATWAIEHKRAPAAVARALDDRLEEDGALFTAWELEADAQASPLGTLLARSVAARHTPRSLLRAILPATAPVLALPFLAATGLFLALEDARFEPREEDVTALTSRLEAELSDLQAADRGAVPEGAEDLSREELNELAQLARDAARIEGGLRREGLEAADELDELQQRLVEAEARAPVGSKLREQLQRASTTLDSALMALSPEGPEQPRGAEETSGEAPPEASSAAPGGATPGSEVAHGGADGTMGGFQTPSIPAEEVVASGHDAPQAGVLSGPAWPAAYDGIVARWVEARRVQDAAR